MEGVGSGAGDHENLGVGFDAVFGGPVGGENFELLEHVGGGLGGESDASELPIVGVGGIELVGRGFGAAAVCVELAGLGDVEGGEGTTAGVEGGGDAGDEGDHVDDVSAAVGQGLDFEGGAGDGPEGLEGIEEGGGRLDDLDGGGLGGEREGEVLRDGLAGDDRELNEDGGELVFGDFEAVGTGVEGGEEEGARIEGNGFTDLVILEVGEGEGGGADGCPGRIGYVAFNSAGGVLGEGGNGEDKGKKKADEHPFRVSSGDDGGISFARQFVTGGGGGFRRVGSCGEGSWDGCREGRRLVYSRHWLGPKLR